MRGRFSGAGNVLQIRGEFLNHAGFSSRSSPILMSTNPPTPALERDPVCGMNVNPAIAKHIQKLGGKTYHFCCAPCLEKFKADPAKYLNLPAPAQPSGLVTLGATMPASTDLHSHQLPSTEAPPSTTEGATYVCPMCPDVREPKPGACPSCGMALEAELPVASTRTEYVCPMHPEIIRPAPGSCPICGMSLEPRTVTAAAEESPELRDMTRRFWISVALTAPLLAVAMGAMFWEMPLHHDAFMPSTGQTTYCYAAASPKTLHPWRLPSAGR